MSTLKASHGISDPRPKPRPWMKRPIDLLYFSFLLFSLFAGYVSDLQPFYPPSLIPTFIANIPEYHIQTSNDPLVAGSAGKNGPLSNWEWFRAMIIVEGFVQLPIAMIGIYYLRKDSPKSYLYLLIYAVSTATSTYPCVSAIYSYPVSAKQLINVDGSIASLALEEKNRLLMLYLPFLFVPMLMIADMGRRVTDIFNKGVEAARAAKRD